MKSLLLLLFITSVGASRANEKLEVIHLNEPEIKDFYKKLLNLEKGNEIEEGKVKEMFSLEGDGLRFRVEIDHHVVEWEVGRSFFTHMTFSDDTGNLEAVSLWREVHDKGSDTIKRVRLPIYWLRGSGLFYNVLTTVENQYEEYRTGKKK